MSGYSAAVYFFIFLPLALIAYQIVGQKYRKYVLLIFSYLFFIVLSKKLVLYIIAESIFVYGAALWIGKCRKEKSPFSKHAIRISIIALLAILYFLKYFNFSIKIINAIANRSLPEITILVPIGISYYTLEAIGYLLEVHWGRVEAEKSFVKVALFLSFFPQIMEGPIARFQDTADQLVEGKGIQEEFLLRGTIRLIWGLGKKIIIADRLSLVTTAIFDSYTLYYGGVYLFAAVAYTLQLYMEFSGVIDMVIGSAEMFGIHLPENFRQPFFAKGPAEFWRRWHITLGVWFKNYIFYPVTISKTVKKWNKFARKKFGKYIAKLGVSFMALLPVWLCNGLWHGPRGTYIFYGVYYFVILFIEVAIEPAVDRFRGIFHIAKDAKWWNALRMVKTWIIIITGEMFFRALSINAGFTMLISIFKDPFFEQFRNGVFANAMQNDLLDQIVVILGCVIVFAVDYLKERGMDPITSLMKQKTVVRWVAYYVLIFSVVIFGAYGAGYQVVDLIYAGF
jgi:alginate O-acetyltransferase complex protein AlgI